MGSVISIFLNFLLFTKHFQHANNDFEINIKGLIVGNLLQFFLGILHHVIEGFVIPLNI